MNYDDIKSIVGVAGNVTITTDRFRFSELLALAKKVNACESGSLTIIVKHVTLRDMEIEALANAGGQYLCIDFSLP